MHRLIKFCALPFVLTGWAAWNGGHNLFTATGFGVWAALIGFSLLVVMFENGEEAILIDNPLPATHALDVQTAVDAVKSALISWKLGALQWQLLRIDVDRGLIAACLDIMEQSSTEPSQSCPRISQLLLLAEFDSKGSRTRVKLRWNVRTIGERTFHNQIIRELSGIIAQKLSCASTPQAA